MLLCSYLGIFLKIKNVSVNGVVATQASTPPTNPTSPATSDPGQFVYHSM